MVVLFLFQIWVLFGLCLGQPVDYSILTLYHMDFLDLDGRSALVQPIN